MLRSAPDISLYHSLFGMRSEGNCMDIITSQPSTVPNAGHGAFSTRAVPQGSIVSLAPMITVTNGPGAMEVSSPANATRQLLLNYCMGHVESNLLLCPTTQTALINHVPPTRTPNVGIRWYHDPDIPEYDQWILQSLQDLTSMDASNPKTMQSRLVIEYVALRDIEEGEELFLDYSGQWQDALEIHLQHGFSSAGTMVRRGVTRHVPIFGTMRNGRCFLPSTSRTWVWPIFVRYSPK